VETAPPPDASTAAMTAAYFAATAALRSRLLGFVAMAYAAQGDYRDAAAEAFVLSVVPTVLAAQQVMAGITSAYLAHLIAAAGGGTTTPVGISQDVLSSLRGVDPTEVYRRPYVQVWTELSRGKPLDTAVAAGERRAQSIAATDLQLAKTHAAQEVLSRDHRVVGYRRVLTGATSCGLCVVASTVRYHKRDLLPIHPGCDCAIAPIIGSEDPGRMINSAILSDTANLDNLTPHGVNVYRHDDVLEFEGMLDSVHQAVRDRFGQSATDARSIDYRKVITVQQHSEIGPILTVSDHLFTKKDIGRGNLRAKPGTFGKSRG
jgi:hypothetical protein